MVMVIVVTASRAPPPAPASSGGGMLSGIGSTIAQGMHNLQRKRSSQAFAHVFHLFLLS